jgi:hypothetical protein
MIAVANVPEPNITRGRHPENALQFAVVNESKALLRSTNVRFILVEGFGLDVALFIE